jgi:hypothetical protein
MLQTEHREVRIRFPKNAFFKLLKYPDQLFYPMGMSIFLLERKRPQREADHTSQIIERVKNAWRYNFTPLYAAVPIPGAARSKAWAFGRAFAGILGSNCAGDMDACLL